MTEDQVLNDGIKKFNDGRFDQALKVFAGIANKSSKNGNYDAYLWEAMTEIEMFRYNDAKSAYSNT